MSFHNIQGHVFGGLVAGNRDMATGSPTFLPGVNQYPVSPSTKYNGRPRFEMVLPQADRLVVRNFNFGILKTDDSKDASKSRPDAIFGYNVSCGQGMDTGSPWTIMSDASCTTPTSYAVKAADAYHRERGQAITTDSNYSGFSKASVDAIGEESVVKVGLHYNPRDLSNLTIGEDGIIRFVNETQDTPTSDFSGHDSSPDGDNNDPDTSFSSGKSGDSDGAAARESENGANGMSGTSSPTHTKVNTGGSGMEGKVVDGAEGDILLENLSVSERLEALFREMKANIDNEQGTPSYHPENELYIPYFYLSNNSFDVPPYRKSYADILRSGITGITGIPEDGVEPSGVCSTAAEVSLEVDTLPDLEEGDPTITSHAELANLALVVKHKSNSSHEETSPEVVDTFELVVDPAVLFARPLLSTPLIGLDTLPGVVPSFKTEMQHRLPFSLPLPLPELHIPSFGERKPVITSKGNVHHLLDDPAIISAARPLDVVEEADDDVDDHWQAEEKEHMDDLVSKLRASRPACVDTSFLGMDAEHFKPAQSSSPRPTTVKKAWDIFDDPAVLLVSKPQSSIKTVETEKEHMNWLIEGLRRSATGQEYPKELVEEIHEEIVEPETDLFDDTKHFADLMGKLRGSAQTREAGSSNTASADDSNLEPDHDHGHNGGAGETGIPSPTLKDNWNGQQARATVIDPVTETRAAQSVLQDSMPPKRKAFGSLQQNSGAGAMSSLFDDLFPVAPCSQQESRPVTETKSPVARDSKPEPLVDNQRSVNQEASSIVADDTPHRSTPLSGHTSAKTVDDSDDDSEYIKTPDLTHSRTVSDVSTGTVIQYEVEEVLGETTENIADGELSEEHSSDNEPSLATRVSILQQNMQALAAKMGVGSPVKAPQVLLQDPIRTQASELEAELMDSATTVEQEAVSVGHSRVRSQALQFEKLSDVTHKSTKQDETVPGQSRVKSQTLEYERKISVAEKSRPMSETTTTRSRIESAATEAQSMAYLRGTMPTSLEMAEMLSSMRMPSVPISIDLQATQSMIFPSQSLSNAPIVFDTENPAVPIQSRDTSMGSNVDPKEIATGTSTKAQDVVEAQKKSHRNRKQKAEIEVDLTSDRFLLYPRTEQPSSVFESPGFRRTDSDAFDIFSPSQRPTLPTVKKPRQYIPQSVLDDKEPFLTFDPKLLKADKRTSTRPPPSDLADKGLWRDALGQVHSLHPYFESGRRASKSSSRNVSLPGSSLSEQPMQDFSTPEVVSKPDMIEAQQDPVTPSRTAKAPTLSTPQSKKRGKKLSPRNFKTSKGKIPATGVDSPSYARHTLSSSAKVKAKSATFLKNGDIKVIFSPVKESSKSPRSPRSPSSKISVEPKVRKPIPPLPKPVRAPSVRKPIPPLPKPAPDSGSALSIKALLNPETESETSKLKLTRPNRPSNSIPALPRYRRPEVPLEAPQPEPPAGH